MFAGEYLCKVDEKGRFIVPSPIRERLELEGNGVVFLKGTDQSLWVYSSSEWEKSWSARRPNSMRIRAGSSCILLCRKSVHPTSIRRDVF